jgi:RNA polymerase sigma factor (sigma-70 family)
LTPQEKLRRFEEKISPHFKSAYNLAKWLTRSHEDAEDVAQDAFLRAFSAFESFRGEDAKPWLLTIVRNTSMTLLKRNRNTGTAIAFEETLDPSEQSPGPEEILLKSCDREQVRDALEQLPAEFREVVVLREIEDLSYKEISIIIGIPLGTVMSRLSRGRECLRRVLSNPKPANPKKEPAYHELR